MHSKEQGESVVGKPGEGRGVVGDEFWKGELEPDHVGLVGNDKELKISSNCNGKLFQESDMI